MLCTVYSQIFPKNKAESDNGFYIMKYVCNETAAENPEAVNQFGDDMCGEVFTAKGYFLPRVIDMQCDLKGHWEKDTKYNTHVFVIDESSEKVQPDEVGITRFLTECVKGVGCKSARKIYKAFGADTLKILDENPERLREIEGISEKKLEKIIVSYTACRGARNVVMTLAPLGVKSNLSLKIYDKYRDDAYYMVKNEPFKLCDIKGINYRIANSIALKNGLDPKSPDRIKAALMDVLIQAEFGGDFYKHTSGHLCVPFKEWQEKAHELLGNVPYKDIALCANALHKEKKVIIWEDPEWEDPEGKIKRMFYVYRVSIGEAEISAAKALVGLCKGEKKPSYDVNDEINAKEVEEGFALHPEQRNAVFTGLSNAVSVITGGPGTGKTTIINFIRTIYHKNNPDKKILLCAPTGKAAIRMSESTKAEACTIHHALGIIAGEDDIVDKVILDYDFIIVDESSMIDIYVARILFEAVRAGAQLCLIGDVDQLPSVGPGEVLSEIINSGVIKVAKLTKVYRQKGDSLIALNSFLIKKGKTDLDYGDTFRFVPATTFEEAAEKMSEIYLTEAAVEGQDNVMMLSPFRQTTASGCNEINAGLRDKINPPSPDRAEVEIGDRVFRVGDKVIQTKNVGEISNGDLGYIIKIILAKSKEDMKVVIDFGFNRIVEYDYDAMKNVEWSYAMTVHKSQGSEAKIVIFNILKGHGPMLRRNLLYTAITRAK